MAELEFRDLRKAFPGGTVAVESLNLVVADGEFLVLVGPSGSGKTTVLRMAAGLERATSGDVLIAGEVVNDVAPPDRDIAMVFQTYALYPHMTVYDNMAFGLKLHGVKKDEIRRRVQSAAEMLELDDLLKRKPSQLSGGQRQRVAMGRAIVREPAAYLMDEPLSNLDAKLRVEMRTYLAELHQRLRTTTLYVTHDQTEAMTMGDRVAVMKDGRLQQVDTPQALYDRPANAFVAAFIGSPAMNLLRGRLSGADGPTSVSLGESVLPLPRSLLTRRPSLAGYLGREVVVGVRPEDIEDAALVPSANGASLPVQVKLAEALGAEVIAHFPLGAGDDASSLVTARLSPRSQARSGKPLQVAIDLERLYFFDPESQEAIV
ncbi:MAG TPA: sn-glycerol-3-phosphate ABC transporter ATP-binding protein UgpC [Gaiellaceae bacterium]|jgi:multiple sugar transport system ATP-binding protein|nr:sn-glycerol-3-phosphate ABC transporter ATP-binding protein UgpC [Gaiellaceae bacterium]